MYKSQLEEGVEYEEGQWVANAETGVMEWHAADGSVISEAEWNAQAAAATETVDEAPPEAAADDTPADDGATDGDDTAADDSAVAAESTDQSESEPIDQ